jgi:hypothetical protein
MFVWSFLMSFFVRIVFVKLLVIFYFSVAEANALLNCFDLLQIRLEEMGVTENSRFAPVCAGLRRSAPVDKKLFFTNN